MPALPTPTRDDDLSRLHDLIAKYLRSTVTPAGGLPYLEGLIEQAATLKGRWEWVALQILLARYHSQDAQGLGMDHALQIVQSALPTARELEDQALTVRILSSIGIIMQRRGLYAEALHVLTESVKVASTVEDQFVRFMVLNNTATFHLTNESYAEGLELLEQAEEAARACGNEVGVSICRLNQVGALNRLGRHQQALQVAEDLRQKLTSSPDYLLHLVSYVVASLNGLSRHDEAEEQAREGILVAEAAGSPEWQGTLNQGMARTLQHLGRWPEALAYARKAHEQLLGRGHADDLRDSQHCLFELNEALGDLPEALNWLKQYQREEAEHLNRMLSARSSAFAVQARVTALEAQAAVERRKNAELGDVIAELHRTEDALRYQSTHDALTGLRNRISFQQRAQVLLNTLPPGSQAAMIFIDLDSFKGVNDLYSHAAGDDLLLQVAQRLTSIRTEILAGRIGGDEFVLLLPVKDADEAEQLASRLLSLLSEPFTLKTGDRVEISGSAGIAMAPRDGHEADVLQHRADQAMYASKHQFSGTVQFYSAQLGEAREARLRLESDLRWAVRSQELRLHYQGKFDVPTQTLQGFEALLRWERPGVGLVSPQVFIPVAEQSQTMLTIGGWVLEEACRQAVDWNFAGRGLSMAVNVSVMQFQQPDFLQVVEDTLRRTGCEPRALTIELTETVILRDLNHARHGIGALRKIGVQVSMDDFGTGYSSLSVLRNLPLDFLKIDRSFMQGIHQPRPAGAKAEVMLATIVQLAHQLGMQVTAEGLELEAQLHFLKAIGCDQAQGFLLGKPEPAAQAALRLP